MINKGLLDAILRATAIPCCSPGLIMVKEEEDEGGEGGGAVMLTRANLKVPFSSANCMLLSSTLQEVSHLITALEISPTTDSLPKGQEQKAFWVGIKTRIRKLLKWIFFRCWASQKCTDSICSIQSPHATEVLRTISEQK